MNLGKKTFYRVAVIGCGYVGLSMAVLLSRQNQVIAADIDQRKVDLLNRRMSPIADHDIEEYLKNQELNLSATTDVAGSCRNADFIIISTPTNYDETNNAFDTRAVESVIETAYSVNPYAAIVIKSTIPVGFTQKIYGEYKDIRLIFSPEFLREGRALHDNLYPSRIIVGVPEDDERLWTAARTFANLLDEAAIKENIHICLISSSEAESVKLFANTYLAMRIAFFNELDSFALKHGMNSMHLIEGIGYDPRIGMDYNNPSFGYGGYCLPKDTKQLKSNFIGTPQNLISAIIDSNETRKAFIIEQVVARIKEIAEEGRRPVIGVYRLSMKEGSDNCRNSAMCDIVDGIPNDLATILIYENSISNGASYGCHRMVDNLEELKQQSDLILANRFSAELEDVQHKLFTRDIYGRD